MAYVVIIRTKDYYISPIAIGPFDTREQAQAFGDNYDYRLRADQLWSVTQIAIPSPLHMSNDT